MERNRALFANSFCIGRGVEIGALHHPLRLPLESKVRYVDRMGTEELRRTYRELANETLVHVDIIDDGETLATLPDGREDFVAACQFLEHCENPIRALVNMLRVVRNRGFVFLTLPDKRQTFDKDRPLTTIEHILEECMHGVQATARDHFREYTRLVDKTPDHEVEARVDWHMERKTSIHYHVWDPDAFLKFLLFAKEKFHLPFDIFAMSMNGNEMMVALQKRLNQ
jgi:SAM-dependent methyltransferase